MGWTIILEDENKAELHAISKELNSNIINYESKSESFKLLKYLDPYGDTVFNRMQIDDLIEDLLVLKVHESNKHLELIDKIIALANRCKNEAHTYLIFYGD